MALNELAATHVHVVEELQEVNEPFVRVRSLRLQHFQEATPNDRSAIYRYDLVERRATDAVVIVLYRETQGVVEVCLRTSIRPPLALRAALQVPMNKQVSARLWELPAGLIEPAEHGQEGLLQAAIRETEEETGFRLGPRDFCRLAGATFLSPGVIAEQLHFFVANVAGSSQGTPTEDGSELEARAVVEFFALDCLLDACDTGGIQDAKSEVGIRRFARWFQSRGER